jgi:hypothetical protein
MVRIVDFGSKIEETGGREREGMGWYCLPKENRHQVVW